MVGSPWTARCTSRPLTVPAVSACCATAPGRRSPWNDYASSVPSACSRRAPNRVRAVESPLPTFPTAAFGSPSCQQRVESSCPEDRVRPKTRDLRSRLALACFLDRLLQSSDQLIAGQLTRLALHRYCRLVPGAKRAFRLPGRLRLITCPLSSAIIQSEVD